MYQKYLKTSFILFFTSMFLVASVNFIVDPGEIYLKKIIANVKSLEFSSKLFESENGIVQTGWNERLVKVTLAKHAGDFDCIILGSSHTMQVSSVRNTGNINNQCSNLLNLSVSGGGIEDISIFTYVILNNFRLPKKIFINIDPWTLKFGMDSRYAAYNDYYNQMNILLRNKENGEDISYLSKVINNLFNMEYLYASITSLLDKTEQKKTISDIFNKQIIFPSSKFSYEDGYKEAVTLIDGSHVYKNTWLLDQKRKNYENKIGSGKYKISGEVYDVFVLDYLQKIIDIYKHHYMEVNFIMTPYHPNVFDNGDTKPVKHITIMDKVVRQLANTNEMKLYGSFFPNKLGCKSEEFLDDMHATTSCLNRIDFSK